MVHGYNNSDSDFISELCWALPFNRQGAATAMSSSVFGISFSSLRIFCKDFFFLFWQRRHSKRPTAQLPCRLQVPLPNGAEKLELCRWRKPPALWFDPDSFTPSPTIHRTQRFKQMLDQRPNPNLHQSNKYSNSITELSIFKFSAIPQLGITL